MKAHAEQLTRLISTNGAVFNIPVYQRNYTWTIDECSQLFNDLENILEKQKHHFIGSVVYIPVGSWSRPSFNIIDGQQRITSVMLLLKSLFDSSTNEAFRQNVMHNLLATSNYAGNISLRLKQVETDSVVYDKLLLMDPFDESAFTDKEKQTNVYKNYKYFVERFLESEYSEENLLDAIYMLDIIDVCLEDEDPQEVFESLNSTGKELTNTDLLRNYLLMAIPRDLQEKFYNQYWAQIEQNVGLKHVEQFMTFFLIICRKSDSIQLRHRSAKVNKVTLYDAYKQFFARANIQNDGDRYDFIEDFLRGAYEYSIIYKRFVSDDRSGCVADLLLHELMDVLNAPPVAIFLMYLLNIQKNDHISDEDMLLAIRACTSYVVRCKVCGRNNVGSNQFFALAIQSFDKYYPDHSFIDSVWMALVAGQGTYAFPSNAEFQSALENKDIYGNLKPGVVLYLLYSFERRRTKELVDCIDASVEHILPQKFDQWKTYLSEQHDVDYEMYLHTLGNLTLTKVNSELSNKPFANKKEMYKDSGFALTREIAGYSKWNSTEIRRRSHTLAMEALLIWSLPAQFRTESVNTDSYAMSDEVEDLYESFKTVIRECYPQLVDMPSTTHINYVLDNRRLFSLVPNNASLFVTLNVESDIFGGLLKLEPNNRHRGVGAWRVRIRNENDIWDIVDAIETMMKNDSNNGVRTTDQKSACEKKVGACVKHSAFGLGRIVFIDESHVDIRFNKSAEVRHFQNPSAFDDGYLTLVDDSGYCDPSESIDLQYVPDGTYYMYRTVQRWNDQEVRAEAKVNNGKWTVQPGSIVCPLYGNKSSGELSPGVCTLRSKANIVNNVLQTEISVDSPSAAAAFCLGNTVDGWTTWRLADGRFIDIYRKKME